MPTTNIDLVAGATFAVTALADSVSTYLIAESTPIEVYFSPVGSPPASSDTGLTITSSEPLVITMSTGDLCFAKSAEGGKPARLIVVT